MDGIILAGAAHKAVGKAYLAADHISSATGYDPAITISKNGGDFANPAAGASVMTEIETDSGWYYFALAAGDTDTLGPLIIKGTHADIDNIEVVYQVVAAVTNANVSQIAGVAAAATKLAASAGTIVVGTVAATASSATVIYSDDIIEATENHYKGRIIIFTTGDLTGQATDITAYVLDTGEGKFTVTALTEAPANDDTFIIV